MMKKNPCLQCLQNDSVNVCLSMGCYTQYCGLTGLSKHLFLTGLEAGTLRSGCQHMWVLVKIFCLAHTANFLLYPHVVEKESWLSGFLLIRALIPR